MSGLNRVGSIGPQTQQQAPQQSGQPYTPTGSRAGLSGSTYTPNLFLQSQLANLYSRMGQGSQPYQTLGGGYMWQPQVAPRSTYAAPSAQFPGSSSPFTGRQFGNPQNEATVYNPMEHSG